MADKDTNVPNKNDFISREAAILEFCDDCIDKKWCKRNGGSCSKINNINAVPAADVVEEENILKFYYVRSIDEYWIGRRLDTLYYARYESENQQWVWTHSRYLPWGEHVVSPTSLWKEHTYPSEPEEIPFTGWLQGFAKKHIAADVRPVVRARWKAHGDCGVTECPVCRWSIEECVDYNFCPNCGADMRELQMLKNASQNADADVMMPAT